MPYANRFSPIERGLRLLKAAVTLVLAGVALLLAKTFLG